MSEPRRNGKLRIDLPFEAALKAATETKLPEHESKKKRPTKKR